MRWEWSEPEVPAMPVTPARPTARFRSSEPTRGRLLTAAVRVYGRDGWDGATTRGIANEAGVNEVTLFRQFGTKQALLTEALRESLRNVVLRLPTASHDPRADLIAWYTAQRASLRGVRAIMQLCAGSGTARESTLQTVGRDTIDAIHRELLLFAERQLSSWDARADNALDARVSMLTATLTADAIWSTDEHHDDGAWSTLSPEAPIGARFVDLFLEGIV